jgi:virginiamycin B lyase
MTMNSNLSNLCGALLGGALLMFGGAANAWVGTVKDHNTPTANADPEGITVASNNQIWFTEQEANKIAAFNPAGKTKHEFTITTPQSGAIGIVQGSDGAFWFTESNVGQIGRVTSKGVVTEYALGTSSSVPLQIALGSDGNVWFTELVAGLIGTIDRKTKAVTEYAIPTSSAFPVGICSGPDGNLWFVEQGVNSVGDYNIGTVTTAGVFTEYDIGANAGVFITSGPDGNIWYTELGTGNVAKFDVTAHTVTEYATPSGGGLQGITTGPDGNLWFTESDAANVARITTDGVITEYALPNAISPASIAAGTGCDVEPYVYVTEPYVSKIGFVYTGDGE